MTQIHTGGCQCGAVRYRAEGEIGFPHLCHCRMCQKAAGNYFLPLGGARHENFTLTRGEPAWFQSSHNVRRGFCSQCGTPLFYDGGHDHISITLGSLDDPKSVKPEMQTNLSHKMPWFDALDTLGHEAEMDTTQEQAAAITASGRQHPDHNTQTWPNEEDLK